MRKLSFVIAVAFLLGGFSSNAIAKLTGYQIAQKAWKANKLEGSEMISTMTIISASGEKRVRKFAAISKVFDGGKTEKRLIRFLYPADVKGSSFLTYDFEKKDDVIWIFLPALRKTRRVMSTEKTKNFMGSEFTYADITPPPVDDFKYKILKTEVIDGVKCWVLENTPKTKSIAKENGFSKRIAWISQKDFVMRKVVYYNFRKEVSKVLLCTNIKEIDTKNHRYRPLKMVMTNKQTKRSSVMQINRIRLRTKIPNRYFTLRFLERF